MQAELLFQQCGSDNEYTCPTPKASSHALTQRGTAGNMISKLVTIRYRYQFRIIRYSQHDKGYI